jgi:hypothetical protein
MYTVDVIGPEQTITWKHKTLKRALSCAASAMYDNVIQNKKVRILVSDESCVVLMECL